MQTSRILSRTPRLFQALIDAGKPTSAVAAYHEKVIDHYENPRNVGSLDKKDDNVGTGLVGAPACGDVMKLQVTVFCSMPPTAATSLSFLLLI